MSYKVVIIISEESDGVDLSRPGKKFKELTKIEAPAETRDKAITRASRLLETLREVD